jgi:hypothetical protein
LVTRADAETVTEHNRYVQLYPQETNCAILYAPGGDFARCPLHLHPGRERWRFEQYQRLLPAIVDAHLEHKSKSQRAHNFILCEIDDWPRLAEALGLQ